MLVSGCIGERLIPSPWPEEEASEEEEAELVIPRVATIARAAAGVMMSLFPSSMNVKAER